MRIKRLLSMCAVSMGVAMGHAHAATLTTSVVTNGGCEGIFFDVTATSLPVRITGFEAVVVGTDEVRVYYRPGGYAGAETNAADWSLLNAAVVSGGTGFINDLYPIDAGSGVVVPGGETYGFLIWINDAGTSGVKAIRYNTSGVPDVAQDDQIRIDSGMGNCSADRLDPFDEDTLNVRSWRGSVIYDVVIEPPPAPALTAIPTLSVWGTVVLAGLIAWGGLLRTRRRS